MLDGPIGLAASSESNYGFFIFPVGHRERARNAFYRVEFKCLPIVVIGRFEFDKDWRGVIVKGGLTAKPKGDIPVSVREVALDGLFVYFVYILIIDG